MRKTIRKILDKAGSFDEFSSLLLQQGVIVKESRGRYSYLTPDRTKPITARKLGDDFDKTAVLAALERNALHPVNTVTKRDATRLPPYLPKTGHSSSRPYRVSRSSVPKPSAPCSGAIRPASQHGTAIFPICWMPPIPVSAAIR